MSEIAVMPPPVAELPPPPVAELPPTKEVIKVPGQEDIEVDVPNARAEKLLDSSTSIDVIGSREFAGAVNEQLDIDQDLIGVLSLGPDEAVGILRVKHQGKDFVALSKLEKSTELSGKRASLMGLVEPGQSVSIGRSDFESDNVTLSRKHVTLTLGDDGRDLQVVDGSLNGTTVVRFDGQVKNDEQIAPKGLRKFLKRSKNPEGATTNLELSDFLTEMEGWAIKSKELEKALKSNDAREANWDYTMLPEDLAKIRGQLVKGYEEPYIDEAGKEVPANYLGRRVISRDSPINKGVYIVPGIQEAIVVDDAEGKPNAAEYEKAFEEFLKLAEAKGVSVRHAVKPADERRVIEAAWLSAKYKLKYDLEYSKDLSRKYADQKVDLGMMLYDGKGVCRHQALLASYFLERLIDGGYMGGKVSVDRNYIKNKGGHAWARYTGSDGQVYIIDPAQDFAGTLKDSRVKADWDYRRPEDTLL